MTDLYVRVGESYHKVGSIHGTIEAVAVGPIGSDYSPAFEAFWASYPRRKGKGAAWKAWSKIKGGAAAYAAIARSLVAHKHSPDWLKQDGQFIPHPATWLNQRRWEDDTAAPSTVPSSVRRLSGVCPGWGDDKCSIRLDGGGRCNIHQSMMEDAQERPDFEPEFERPD